jgi:ornithine cyclodeaminase
MIYLNEKDIDKLGIDWKSCTDTIADTVKCLAQSDVVQPVKPYLRFKDLKNRIIAMPAYVGGKFDIAGIKWIASFPKNIDKKIPRASSVTILNDSNTGQVLSIINTNRLSIIRTVSVSSLVLRYFLQVRNLNNFTVGIIGFGPIGQYHYNMCKELYGDKISKIIIYDLREIDPENLQNDPRVVIAKNWLEAYEQSDVVITCTVSKETYIDKKPKQGSLLLNVSLRDYKTDMYEFVKNSIIVDDWDEVCREKTNIEIFHIEKRLQKENIKSIVDIVINNCIASYSEEQPIMFNPMGMAIFDITIGKHYLNLARENKVGLELE